MIKINVNTAKAVCLESPHPLTAGMVGQQAAFEFSDDWSGLTKNAVVRGSNTTKVVLNINGAFTVPHECLATAGSRLEIGVEGRKADGSVVIPTVFAYIGKIYVGVDDDGEESTPPTPSQVQQLQNAINGKAAAVHTHAQSDVTGLTAALAGKAAAVHTHAVADVTGLQTALDGKQRKLTAGQNITIDANGVISATGGGGGGSVSWSDITGKPSTFTPAAHEHTVSDISDFPSIPTDTLELTNGAGYIKADDVPVSDVKVGTASVVSGGVAKITNGNGIYIDSQGKIQINDPTDGYIYNRSATHGILCSKIDKIVKAALCDGRGADYTETEQAAARARLGISIWDGSVSE